MQYSSPAYFLLFLPFVLLLYKIVPKRVRPKILLLASFLFIFLLSKSRIIFLILSILSIYFSALLLKRMKEKAIVELENVSKDQKKVWKKKEKRKERLVFILCLLFNLGILIVLKYSFFLGTNLNHLFTVLDFPFQFSVPKFILPIGISFYTLQALSYLIDVYRDTICADKNIFCFSLFVSFFPIIMEGPICRYSEIAYPLYQGEDLSYRNITFGAQRILYGLMKKMVIADRLNIIVKTIFDHYASYDGGIILLGAILYTIQLYMDFSGVMDIVIGSGEMFGIRLPENFRQPFFSKNISEFWMRWHITLGKWFKDYIFYPLSLSKGLKRLTMKLRKVLGNHFGPFVSGSIALFCVWLCNGLWHGAAWTYIFFGMYHFCFILFENVTEPFFSKVYRKLHVNKESKIYLSLVIFKTWIIIIIGEMFFRATSLTAGFGMLEKIFTEFSLASFKHGFLYTLGLTKGDFIIVFLILIIVFVISVLKEKKIDVREKIANYPIPLRWTIYYVLILIIIIFGAYGVGYAPVDPLYVNF